MMTISKADYDAIAAEWNKVTKSLKESGYDLSKIKLVIGENYGESEDN